MARVAAGWAGAAVGLTVGACFIKPDAPGVSSDAGDVRDSQGMGDAVAGCAIRDDFTGTNVPLCGDWGTREGSAQSGGTQNFYRSGSGQLVMSSTGSGGSGACQSTVDVPFTVVSVDILRAVTLANAHTGIELTFGDASTFAVELLGVGGANTLTAIVDGTMNQVGGFNATMTKFRIEKNGNSNIALSVTNPSGSNSISNNFYMPNMLDRIRIRLYTDFGANTSYTLAEFDNLDGCAP